MKKGNARKRESENERQIVQIEILKLNFLSLKQLLLFLEKKNESAKDATIRIAWSILYYGILFIL